MTDEQIKTLARGWGIDPQTGVEFAHELLGSTVEENRYAERYRWLRERTDTRDQKPFIGILGRGGISMWNDTSADDAIDAAIALEKKG
jgi:hypothetical protein